MIIILSLLLSISLIVSSPLPSSLQKRNGLVTTVIRMTDNGVETMLQGTAKTTAKGADELSISSDTSLTGNVPQTAPNRRWDALPEKPPSMPGKVDLPPQAPSRRFPPFPSREFFTELDELLDAKNYESASKLIENAPKSRFSPQAFRELVSTAITKGNPKLLIQVINSNPKRSVREELLFMKLARETTSSDRASDFSQGIAINLGKTPGSSYTDIYHPSQTSIGQAENIASDFANKSPSDVERKVWTDISTDLKTYGRPKSHVSDKKSSSVKSMKHPKSVPAHRADTARGVRDSYGRIVRIAGGKRKQRRRRRRRGERVSRPPSLDTISEHPVDDNYAPDFLFCLDSVCGF